MNKKLARLLGKSWLYVGHTWNEVKQEGIVHLYKPAEDEDDVGRPNPVKVKDFADIQALHTLEPDSAKAEIKELKKQLRQAERKLEDGKNKREAAKVKFGELKGQA